MIFRYLSNYFAIYRFMSICLFLFYLRHINRLNKIYHTTSAARLKNKKYLLKLLFCFHADSLYCLPVFVWPWYELYNEFYRLFSFYLATFSILEAHCVDLSNSRAVIRDIKLNIIFMGALYVADTGYTLFWIRFKNKNNNIWMYSSNNIFCVRR